MASLKKFPGSPYWYACYRQASGERAQRSTGLRDKKKAREVARALEMAARLAGQGLLTESKARRWISDLVEQTTGEPLNFYTAESWLKEWVAGKEQTKAERTGTRYAQVIQEFINHLGKRADLNIAHIAPSDLKAFRDTQIRDGKAPLTCNLAVKVISGAFNAARRQGLVPTNPAEALESLQHRSESKEAFTDEQLADLLKAAPSVDWRGAMLLAYFTGARLRDVANMKWDAVELAGKLIRFTPQKTARTGKRITMPLHPQLEAHLMSIAGQDNPQAFLFPTLEGRETGGAKGLSRTFSNIMAKAGITPDAARPRKGEKGRAVSRLSFHSFRHGFNSAMANNGIAQEIRQKLTGHASAEVNQIYTHYELEPLRNAVQSIPDIKVK